MQKNIEKFSLKRLLVRKQALLMALLIALLMALWVQLPRLLDPYAVEDDFRNLYWVHQYRNPELFPRDQILVHDVNQEVAPGYAVLFRLGTALVSPILLHKLLIFPLMLIAVYYVYRIVEQMAGERAALVAGVAFAVFNLTAGTEISATSGLQRSFALPLLAAFAYYLMRRRHPIAAVIVFSSGVIYFPAVPTMAITYVLSCLSLSKGESRRLVISWRPLAYLLFALFAAVALVMPVLMWQAGKAFSTPDNASEKVHFLQDPAYAEGGRRFLFHLFPLVGRGGIVTLPHSAVQLGILGFVALVASFVRQRPIRNLPSVLIKLLAAGFISFVLAWLALFVTSSFILYIPSRHTHAVLFLSLVIYISVNIPETVRATALWLRPYRNRSVAVVAPAVILALLAFLLSPLQAEYYREVSWMPLARWSLPGLVVTLVTLSYQSATKRDDEELIWSRGNCEAPERLGRIILATGFLALSLYYVTVMSRSAYRPSGDARPLFSYVNTLPTGALLAGDPCTLDSVPLYGRRSVLFNCDRHGHLSREAIRDALSAYYAAEWDEVYAFCERYGVSHLVVNAESYTDDVVKNRGYFFEPYASQVGDIIRSRPRYILAGTPVENRLFEAGDFYVVACQDGEQAID